jgi:hypothetical protein
MLPENTPFRKRSAIDATAVPASSTPSEAALRPITCRIRR